MTMHSIFHFLSHSVLMIRCFMFIATATFVFTALRFVFSAGLWHNNYVLSQCADAFDVGLQAGHKINDNQLNCLDTTSTEVDNEISQEDCVADAVEDNPVGAEIVVEERDSNRKRDHVGQQQNQHHQIPVQSTHVHAVPPSDMGY